MIRDHSHTKTLMDVKDFLASLPKIALSDLEEGDDTCGICWVTYKELEPKEHVLKLPCGHCFSSHCLENLLGPKPDGWGHKLCPLCRQEVRVNKHMKWMFKAGSGISCRSL